MSGIGGIELTEIYLMLLGFVPMLGLTAWFIIHNEMYYREEEKKLNQWRLRA